ncbi:MAG: hypothetical protein IKV59_04340 [Lachnospiraceae bacterium]|nr:hypothetical protein [Lachnospiraceae bacterium]
MLKKLIKYDLKSMLRQFVPMWILMLVVAMMLGISSKDIDTSFMAFSLSRTRDHAIMGTMMLVFAAVMVALIVMTILFCIQRFWDGLLKEEGYLMFTLPVEAWELVTAKGIVATLVTCASIFVGILSIVVIILFSSDEVLEVLSSSGTFFYRTLFQNSESPYYWISILLWLLIGIFSVAKSIYQIYAAMALGHLFEKHRVAGACISYVGISAILSFVGNIAMNMIDSRLGREMIHSSMELMESVYPLVYYLSVLLLTVIQLIIFHVIIERVLSTRLNLE